MKEEVKPIEVLKFQNRRHITGLFRRFLEILQRVSDEHDIALDKLIDVLPDQYKPSVGLADYFTDEQFELWRKEILDIGNRAIRELDAEIDQYKDILQ